MTFCCDNMANCLFAIAIFLCCFSFTLCQFGNANYQEENLNGNYGNQRSLGGNFITFIPNIRRVASAVHFGHPHQHNNCNRGPPNRYNYNQNPPYRYDYYDSPPDRYNNYQGPPNRYNSYNQELPNRYGFNQGPPNRYSGYNQDPPNRYNNFDPEPPNNNNNQNQPDNNNFNPETPNFDIRYDQANSNSDEQPSDETNIKDDVPIEQPVFDNAGTNKINNGDVVMDVGFAEDSGSNVSEPIPSPEVTNVDGLIHILPSTSLPPYEIHSKDEESSVDVHNKDVVMVVEHAEDSTLSDQTQPITSSPEVTTRAFGLIHIPPDTSVVFPNNDNKGDIPIDHPKFVNRESEDAVMVVEYAEDSTTKSAVEVTSQGGLTRIEPSNFETRDSMDFNAFQQTCPTAVGGVGRCILLDKCVEFKQMLTLNHYPTVLSLLRKSHCGYEGFDPKVCCPLTGIPTAPPPTYKISMPEPSTQPPVNMSESKPKIANDGLYVDHLPEAPECGVANSSINLIVKESPVELELGAFPWMALLGYRPSRDGASTRWLCGGSLISTLHVLTAAHCIQRREHELYLVRLGELDLARDDDGATPIDVPIKQHIIHEKYNRVGVVNDIGVLVMAQDIQYTALIKPICLPATPEFRSNSYENYTPFVAGWGYTEFSGPPSTRLLATQLPITTKEACAKAYSQYKAQRIDEKVLCAGYEQGGKDACKGDSGGPLMQPLRPADARMFYFYQIGVVSYGRGCAEAGFPGVYSRTTYFYPWILEKTVGHT